MALMEQLENMAFALNNTRVVRSDRAPACDELLGMVGKMQRHIDKHGDPTLSNAEEDIKTLSDEASYHDNP